MLLTIIGIVFFSCLVFSYLYSFGSYVASKVALEVKNPPAKAEEETGSIPGLGRNHSNFLSWSIAQTEDMMSYSPRGPKESDTTEGM